jgi:hypothetical protein
MNRHNQVRALRIILSAAFAILCILSIALWVRSYRRLDWLRIRGGPSVASVEGQLLVNDVCNINPHQPQLVSTQVERQLAGGRIRLLSYHAGALLFVGVGNSIPDWLAVVVTGALSALAWMPRRFSLRAFLIATTLIAMVMAMIVLSR